jgi:serine/threonine-protein kinase CLA4
MRSVSNGVIQGLPDAWSKLLTKSAITREDYAKDPQAVLDVLEFYTDHQKREMEELGIAAGRQNSLTGSSTYSGTSTLTPYGDNVSAPRYAGIGLAGSGVVGKTSLDRPQMKRQDSAPAGLNGDTTSVGLARAAELVNGSHAQYTSIGTGAQSRPGIPPLGPSSLQPSRPAPPRPLLTANRPAPPAPLVSGKPPLPDHTPSSADLRARAKAQGPPTETQTAKPPGLAADGTPVRKESLGDKSTRPNIAPAKSSPANTLPASQPASGAAGSTVGPPPVKPLQPKKPTPQAAPPAAPDVTVTGAEKDGGIAAAAAALEKPKVQEKRISTMNEAQIMEKLRSVVSDEDPKQLYSKIRKVGQG